MKFFVPAARDAAMAEGVRLYPDIEAALDAWIAAYKAKRGL
jgi:hypothetical protein